MRQVKLIKKKEFIVTALDLKNKAFIIHVASISKDSHINLSHKAQIASLKDDKAFFFILSKYTDFIDVFSIDLV